MTEPLHIVHVVRDLDSDSGGLTRAVAQLAEALLEQGITSSMFYQCRQKDVIELAPELQRLEFSNLNMLYLVGARGKLRRVIDQVDRERPVSLFHLHGLWDGLTNATARIAQQRGIGYLCSTHGMLEPWSLDHKPWRKQIAWNLYQKKTLKNALALHATADKEADSLQKLGLTAPRFVIANGIQRSPPVNLANRMQSPRIALFLSRLHPVKGIEMLIDAWQKLRPKGWICQIIGPGEPAYLDSLRTRIHDAGLDQEILLLKPLTDHEKWAAFERASLFVLPSYTETSASWSPRHWRCSCLSSPRPELHGQCFRK